MVEVFIPTLNSECTLAQCLENLLNNGDVSPVIVDGGSVDATVEIAKAYGIKVLVNTGSLGQVRTQMCELAQGDFFVMLDSDVYLAPDSIAQLLAVAKLLDAGAVMANNVDLPVIEDRKFALAVNAYIRWRRSKRKLPFKNPSRLLTIATLFKTSAVKGFSFDGSCIEDYMLGKYVRQQDFDVYLVDVPVIHCQPLTRKSYFARFKVAGANMHLTRSTSFARLVTGLIVNVFRVPSPAKRLAFSIYLSQLEGYIHSRHFYKAKWSTVID